MTRPRRLHTLTPAKLNLGLEVVGRRPDGYHDIVTILQTISVFDRFTWTATGRPFEYVGPVGLARDEDLTWRALRTATDFDNWTGRLGLVKAVPLAAGLGGGSSDAALALRLAHPSAADSRLPALAGTLGADVPFFLEGGTALATGAGTSLSTLNAPDIWFVVVSPAVRFAAKTQMLYRGLTDDAFSSGDEVRRAAELLASGRIPVALPNAFAGQLSLLPEVRAAIQALHRAGAAYVAITGAGPSVYALTATYHEAARIATRLPAGVGTITLARSITRRLDDPSSRAVAQALRSGAPGT